MTSRAVVRGRAKVWSWGLALAAVVGCDDWGSDDATGSVRVLLSAPAGVRLSEAEYTFSRRGQAQLGDRAALSRRSFVVSDVPVGRRYNLAVTAFGSGGVVCTGETLSPFRVRRSVTRTARVRLSCQRPAPVEGGEVSVGVDFNLCPSAPLLAAPAVLSGPDPSVELSALASDPDGDVLSFAWEATAGSVEVTGDTSARFSCEGPGAVEITVSADDGQGCVVPSRVSLRCDLDVPVVL